MRKNIINLIAFLIFLLPFIANAQVTELNRLGQTPGGASFHVNWDSTGHKIIAGCGTIIWVYDLTNQRQVYPHNSYTLLKV